MQEQDFRKMNRTELMRLIQELTDGQEKLHAQAEESKKQLSEAKDNASANRKALKEMQAQLMAAQQEESVRREELAEARSEAKNARLLIDSLRGQLIDAQTALTGARAELEATRSVLHQRDHELGGASMKIDALEKQTSGMQQRLENRAIAIEQAGTLAQASIELNGLLAAAQSTADQYLENIRSRMAEQDRLCAEIEAGARAEAEEKIRTAEEKCAQMLREAEEECEQMKYIAEEENRRKWSGLSEQLQMISREIITTVGGPEKK